MMGGKYVCVHCMKERGNGCRCVSPFDDTLSDLVKRHRMVSGILARAIKRMPSFLTPLGAKLVANSSRIDHMLMNVACRHGVDFDVLYAAFEARSRSLPIGPVAYSEHLHNQSELRERGWDVVGWLNRR